MHPALADVEATSEITHLYVIQKILFALKWKGKSFLFSVIENLSPRGA